MRLHEAVPTCFSLSSPASFEDYLCSYYGLVGLSLVTNFCFHRSLSDNFQGMIIFACCFDDVEFRFQVALQNSSFSRHLALSPLSPHAPQFSK